MTDLVEELLELDNVKVLGYQIKNRAFYIEVESRGCVEEPPNLAVV